MEEVEIARGAEAIIFRGKWLGRSVIIKERVPKSYRHPDLDRRLRNSRIKAEARLLKEVRRAGVRTPLVFDIDLLNNLLVMEHIEGEMVKDLLNRGVDREHLCRGLGTAVARLHFHGIVHGDLTTSNMLLWDGKIYFIDFSLGAKTDSIENKGVDLHLLMEAFRSAHADFYAQGIGWVLEEYREEWHRLEEEGTCPHGPDEVIDKVHEIEKRGRYT